VLAGTSLYLVQGFQLVQSLGLALKHRGLSLLTPLNICLHLSQLLQLHTLGRDLQVQRATLVSQELLRTVHIWFSGNVCLYTRI
jgi:hypothetical protein